MFFLKSVKLKSPQRKVNQCDPFKMTLIRATLEQEFVTLYGRSMFGYNYLYCKFKVSTLRDINITKDELSFSDSCGRRHHYHVPKIEFGCYGDHIYRTNVLV